MNTSNPQPDNSGESEVYKWLLRLLIAAITFSPLLAIVPFVSKQSDMQPRCADLERDYLLAELERKPEKEQLRRKYLAKCEKKPEVKP